MIFKIYVTETDIHKVRADFITTEYDVRTIELHRYVKNPDGNKDGSRNYTVATYSIDKIIGVMTEDEP